MTRFPLLASLAVVATAMFPQGARAAEKLATEKATREIAPLVVKGADPLTRDMFSLISKEGAETLGAGKQPDLLALGRWAELHVCKRTSKNFPSGKPRLFSLTQVLSSSYSSLANFTDSQKKSLKTVCGLRGGKSSFYPYERVYGR